MPTVARQSYMVALCCLVVALSTTSASAGTLVFPQTTQTYVTYCDGYPGHPPTVVPNSSGCNTSATFYSGQFILVFSRKTGPLKTRKFA